MTLDEQIQRIVDQRVEKALEEKLPEIIRALGIKEAEPETDGLVGAEEVAKLLGRDLSTRKNIEKARRHVYDLARQKRIPSVRLSERNVRFDLAKVKEALRAKQQEAA